MDIFYCIFIIFLNSISLYFLLYSKIVEKLSLLKISLIPIIVYALLIIMFYWLSEYVIISLVILLSFSVLLYYAVFFMNKLSVDKFGNDQLVINNKDKKMLLLFAIYIVITLLQIMPVIDPN